MIYRSTFLHCMGAQHCIDHEITNTANIQFAEFMYYEHYFWRVLLRIEQFYTAFVDPKSSWDVITNPMIVSTVHFRVGYESILLEQCHQAYTHYPIIRLNNLTISTTQSSMVSIVAKLVHTVLVRSMASPRCAPTPLE